MIEDGKPCTEIARRLQAVGRAIVYAKRTLDHDHIDHCLESNTSDNEDLRTISRYL